MIRLQRFIARFSRLHAGGLGLLAAAAVALALVRPADGQLPRAGAQQPEFHVYSLTHARAADLEPVVTQVLSAIGEATEVVADTRGNRLLVRGPAQAHKLTYDLVKRLDRPGATPGSAQPVAPSAAAGGAQPVLESYPYGGGDGAAFAARLQSDFPASAGVRIAADARTSQLLVLAPPELHAEIHRRIAAAAPAADNPASRVSSGGARQTSVRQASASAAAQPATVQLARLRPEQLEATLANLWGERLSPLAKTNDEYSSYLLRLSDDARLEVHVNRRTGQIVLRGPAAEQEMAVRLIRALDTPAQTTQGSTRVLPVRTTPPEQLRQFVAAIELLDKPARDRPVGGAPPAGETTTAIRAAPRGAIGLVAQVFQPQGADAGDAQLAQQPAQPAQPGEQPQPPPTVPGAEQPPEEGGVLGPVRIEFLEPYGALIISGNQRDVERVMKIIEEIERLAVETVPIVEVYQLQHVGSEALATIIRELYDQVLSPRQGAVSITALVKPNAVLLVGRAESVKVVTDLIAKLDQAVGPETQFEVFRLKHASAATAQQVVTEFYANRPGLGPRIVATADIRSNSLIVQASPRDLLEVAHLLNRIDTATIPSVNELRVFPLQYTLSSELAPVLQDAISAQGRTAQGAGPTVFPGLGDQAGQAQAAQGARAGAAPLTQRSATLRFLTVDAQGQRQLNSGILTDVRVTADARGNTLVVSAPAESMELIAALINQLDHPPATVSQIKVFTIVNGDAENLVDLLETLFGQPPTRRGGAGGFGAQAVQQLQASSESALVPVRFSVDQRTNSIIASGSAGDLNVVEAILLRLDESDIRQRKTKVYRLKNAPALDVSNAVNEYLRSERTVQQLQPGLLSPFQQIEREVIVVPELVSNSLIVSATPRFYEEITKLVEQLDERPPMVMIQVMIAEVGLNSTDEFGVELGLQDSILFDRSLIGDLVTIATSGTQAVAGGGTITTNTQTIVGASNVPGFAFNSVNIGNSGSDRALSNSGRVGAQGLSNFSVGRINNELGFGGLVFSAGSESVNVLLRALQECRRLEVLSRPQIMTLDNQPAYIQVGQTVPRINGTVTNETGQLVNTLDDIAVGLVLGVTPRISPDGLVVMEINAERSRVGPEAEGIPISVAPNGDVLRSPRIDRILAETTVSAVSGQTVVLGGLITKEKTDVHRRAPILSDIPVLGHLFRFDQIATRRTELLIIMTPHVVRNEEDATRVRQAEAARMSWCLADVEKIHGSMGMRTRGDEWFDAETMVVYPDMNPSGEVVMPPSIEQRPPTPPAIESDQSPMPRDNAPQQPSGPAIHQAQPTSAAGPVVRPTSRRNPPHGAASQQAPALLDPEGRAQQSPGLNVMPTAARVDLRSAGMPRQGTQYQQPPQGAQTGAAAQQASYGQISQGPSGQYGTAVYYGPVQGASSPAREGSMRPHEPSPLVGEGRVRGTFSTSSPLPQSNPPYPVNAQQPTGYPPPNAAPPQNFVQPANYQQPLYDSRLPMRTQ